MSGRYATLETLLTGRGGVHEVRPERLVETPSAVRWHRRASDDDDVASASSSDDAADDPDDDDAPFARRGVTAEHLFASHAEHLLPAPAPPSSAGSSAASSDDRALHVFRLRPRLERRVMRDLLPRARARARRGFEALERLVVGPDGGVVVSNVGGFQSAHDLLEPSTWCYTSDEEEEDEDEDEAAKETTTEALSEPARGSASRALPPPPDDPPPLHKGWGLLSRVVCAAHEAVRDVDRGERRIEPGDLYGWLNANEAGDYNKLHEHGGADSWSGVFYLHCPEPRRRRTGGRGEDVRGESESDGSDGSESESESESESTGVGCLGLRCHAPPEEEGGTDRRGASRAEKAAVPFLRHRPRAGELVLFRGDVLHAVESVGRAPRGRATREARDIDMEDVRLSVAFNEDSRANDAKEREEGSEREREGR